MNPTSLLRRKHQGYSGARPDVVALIPVAPANVLDVGCGAGMTAQLVKGRFPSARVTGLEMDPALASLAEESLDALVRDSVESPAALAM